MSAPRDRFLAFAFAAADLLVETGMDGVILFAAGAFQQRLGAEPDRFVGQRVSRLFSPADQASFAMAMASVSLRGRIAPLVLRLADAETSPVAVAALMMPGPPARLCFTIGPVPAASGPAPTRAGGFEEPLLFVREAELALRAGGDGQIGLVEFEGWQEVQAMLSAQDILDLRAGIRAVLAEAGPGVLAGEIEAGRYGILGNASLDVPALAARLGQVVKAGPAARLTRVQQAAIGLDPGALTPIQAARTLRYAVSRFATGGMAAAAADGAGGGPRRHHRPFRTARPRHARGHRRSPLPPPVPAHRRPQRQRDPSLRGPAPARPPAIAPQRHHPGLRAVRRDGRPVRGT